MPGPRRGGGSELADLELDAMYALTKYVRRRGGNAGAHRGRYRRLKESELKLRRRAAPRASGAWSASA